MTSIYLTPCFFTQDMERGRGGRGGRGQHKARGGGGDGQEGQPLLLGDDDG